MASDVSPHSFISPRISTMIAARRIAIRATPLCRTFAVTTPDNLADYESFVKVCFSRCHVEKYLLSARAAGWKESGIFHGNLVWTLQNDCTHLH
jgi:hypothetical protein